MKQKISKDFTFIAGLALTVCLATLPVMLTADLTLAGRRQYPQATGANDRHQTVKAFEDRVKAYVKMREGLEEKLPKLSKDAKPEEIEAHKKSFQNVVRASRTGAKPGTMFTPDIANHIRAIIKERFRDKELMDLRETVTEAETKGIPVRVNHPYPESKELVEMPPTLLLILPQLPKQLRYRFVGTNMLLVDRENGLIVDYMPNALP
ncbi:MAG TPA: hypothetical protein VE262_11395 [Blastocatellia bacterium]|nr:hypothetical protein [Blastocatellia bacterium]